MAKKDTKLYRFTKNIGATARSLGGSGSSSLTFTQRLRLLRYQARIERLRLQNQQKMLAMKGQVIQRPRLIPSIVRPIQKPRSIFSNITHADIDSAFYADINHGDNSLWGGEMYHDPNDFYNENFFGSENFFDVGIKWGGRGSPLLW